MDIEKFNPKVQLLEFQQAIIDLDQADGKVETEITTNVMGLGAMSLVVYAPLWRGIGHKNFRNLRITWLPDESMRLALSADFVISAKDGNKGERSPIMVATRFVLGNVWKNLDVLEVYVPSKWNDD